MSEDAKNSFALWLWGIGLALLAWASIHFEWSEMLPTVPQWVRNGTLILYPLSFGLVIWLKRRKAADGECDQ